jgi:integrase/recombinase XerC
MRRSIEEFLAYLRHERNASPHTISSYGRDLGQLEAYLIEKKADWRSADNVVLRGFLGCLYEKKR